MRPGDLLLLKPGTHGLAEPRNLAVLLAVGKRGQQLEAYTLRGRVTLNRQRLPRQPKLVHCDGKLSDEQYLKDFLLRAVADGAADPASAASAGVDVEALWAAVEAPLSLRALSGHAGAEVTPEALAEYFAPHGREWRPLTRHERDANAALARELRGLLTTLRRARGAMDDDGRGDDGPAPPLDPDLDAGLDAAQRALLTRLTPLWEARVADDDWPAEGPFHGAAAADGLAWRAALETIARLLSGSRDPAEGAARLLLATGRWDAPGAMAALTLRHAAAVEVPLTYPDHLVRETHRLTDEAPPAGRRDLRGQACWTIDPPDARDFDDAIGLDGDTLWVHIADVSHYVTPQSALDDEARERATSVYLPDRVLSMLPPRLADDLCSLRADVDRLAVSVALTIGGHGAVTAAEPMRSVVRVRENLSYDEALTRADRGEEPFAALLALAARMRAPREGLAVESRERRVRVADGAVTMEWKGATPATAMIETFMVAANEAIAEHLTAAGAPLLYRVHDVPPRSAVEEIAAVIELARLGEPPVVDWEAWEALAPQESLAELAANFAGSVSIDPALAALLAPAVSEAGEAGAQSYPPDHEIARGAMMREALNRLLADDPGAVVTGLVLRTAGQANYTPTNRGHFGLASRCYCHYTSPIRRYPDLVVHRQLKALLRDEPLPHGDDLAPLGDHCSERERRAERLERRLGDCAAVLLRFGPATAAATAPAEEAPPPPPRSPDSPREPLRATVGGLSGGKVFLTLPDALEAAVPTRALGRGLEVDGVGARLLGPPRPGHSTEADEEGQPVEVVLRLGQRLTARPVAALTTEGRVEVAVEHLAEG